MESWKRNLRAASSTSSLDGTKTKNVIKKKKPSLPTTDLTAVDSHAEETTGVKRKTVDKKSRSSIEISKLKTTSPNERFCGSSVRKSASSETLLTKENQKSMKNRRVSMSPNEKSDSKKSTLKPQYPSVPDIRKSSSMGSIYHHGRNTFGKNRSFSEFKISKNESTESDVQDISKSLAGKDFTLFFSVELSVTRKLYLFSAFNVCTVINSMHFRN